ncbi:MAG: sulfate ABC transporter substrate-binding protein [Sandaracinus sp.]
MARTLWGTGSRTFFLFSLGLLAAACSGGGSTPSATGAGSGAAPRHVTLLHASYDPTRELFEDVNRAFAAHELAEHQVAVEVQMSHGGSGRQARAVIDGLPADVVSLALAWDVDSIVTQGHELLPADWATRQPSHGSPFYSTIVMVVRQGNPRGIHGFGDLVHGETQIVTANPRTSGGARWAYLAAYGWALRQPGGTDASATDFVRELFRRVPVLDSGARGASTTFAQNHIGDVLLTWENEAHMLLREMPDAHLEIVVPEESILAEPVVARIDANAEHDGVTDVVDRYLAFLYTPEAQEIEASHFYRVRDEAALAHHAGELPSVRLFTIDEVFGGWSRAQATHFAEGGVFDRISAPAE